MNRKHKTLITITAALLLVLLAITAFLTHAPAVGMSKENREALAQLDRWAAKRTFCRDSITHEMDSVMLQLYKNIEYTDQERYDINRRMLMKAQTFSYEYAHQFASRIQMISEKIGDENMIAEAKILSSYYLAQSCLFPEALELLHSVNLNSSKISTKTQAQYYFFLGITHQRMAVHAKDTIYSRKYNAIGIELFEKCLNYTNDQAIRNFVQGRINERQGNMKHAQAFYEKTLPHIKPEDNTLRSLTLAALGKAHKHQGHSEEALKYYIAATQLDIQESMNSSIAVIDLADFLFSHYKYISEARKYLEISIDNGEFYGMRSQITRIDTIFPKLTEMKKRDNLYIYTSIALFAVGILIFLSWLTIQNNRFARRLVKYEELMQTTADDMTALRETNLALIEKNETLTDAERKKDNMLSKLLETNGTTATMISDFIQKADLLLKTKKYEQLQKTMKTIEEKVDKKKQLALFDQMIRTLTPSFPDEFNELLAEEYRTITDPNGELTPTMRIFALVRMGIKDNQQIAQVLGYSFNTIQNYRTRAKNMALNPDNFEDDVMNIGL